MTATKRGLWLIVVIFGVALLVGAAAGGATAADATTDVDDANVTTAETDVDGIEWRNPSSNTGFQGFDPADTTFAITPNVLIDGELAMDESVEFEVTNEETDSSVTLSPTEEADEAFSDRVRFNLFHRSGDLVEEPHIENVFGDEEIDAEIEGDEDTFTETTIADYDVTLLVDGEELASAESRELTIGYSPQPEAQTDGDRLVVTTDPSGIDADRDVEFELYESGEVGEHLTVRESGTYDADLDRFVYEFDRDDFEHDTAERWGVTIDRDEDDSVFSNSVGQTGLEITEVDEIDIDVPDEEDGDADEEDPADEAPDELATSVERNVDANAVGPGDTVQVTVSGDLNGEIQDLIYNEAFDPEFTDVTFQGYHLDGGPSVADVNSFESDGVTVTHLGSNDSIAEDSFEISYQLEVDDEIGTEHALTDGSVTLIDMDDEETEFDFDDTSIEVVETTDLAIEANETDVNTGETIGFTVTEDDTGDAVENATVGFEELTRTATTDENGTAEITFRAPGEFNATASKAAVDDGAFNDSDSVAISIEAAPDDEVAEYRDPNTDSVEIDGLRRGIGDFTGGDASIDVLRQLIGEFTS